jgi:hypothetical protein
MKKLITIPTAAFLLLFSATGCHNGTSNPPPPPPPAGSANIVISNIEIRPNPYHLYPATNYKAGEYYVLVSVTNTGTAACTASLFFTLKVLKADQYGNFNSAATGIGGATLTDPVSPNETKYVKIAIDGWLTLATAQGDFDTVAGTYKTSLAVTANDPITINQTIPESLFQVVKQ